MVPKDKRDSRDQEVLRANKVLAAYFKGQRTDREARAALKIIKAFVRDRERTDPRHRSTLPLVSAPRTANPPARAQAVRPGRRLIGKGRPRQPFTRGEEIAEPKPTD
jgi:hypothetical protein